MTKQTKPNLKEHRMYRRLTLIQLMSLVFVTSVVATIVCAYWS